jgi:hypothetical protein
MTLALNRDEWKKLLKKVTDHAGLPMMIRND